MIWPAQLVWVFNSHLIDLIIKFYYYLKIGLCAQFGLLKQTKLFQGVTNYVYITSILMF